MYLKCHDNDKVNKIFQAIFTSPMLLWHNANFTCNEIELTDVEKVQSDKILNVICKKLVGM